MVPRYADISKFRAPYKYSISGLGVVSPPAGGGAPLALPAEQMYVPVKVEGWTLTIVHPNMVRLILLNLQASNAGFQTLAQDGSAFTPTMTPTPGGQWNPADQDPLGNAMSVPIVRAAPPNPPFLIMSWLRYWNMNKGAAILMKKGAAGGTLDFFATDDTSAIATLTQTSGTHAVFMLPGQFDAYLKDILQGGTSHMDPPGPSSSGLSKAGMFGPLAVGVVVLAGMVGLMVWASKRRARPS